MATTGFIPQIQLAGQTVIQKQALLPISQDTAGQIVQPNGLTISNQPIFSSSPLGISSIISSGTNLGIQQAVDSIQGTSQQLNGQNPLTVGAAAALGLAPAAVTQIAQTISGISIGGTSIDSLISSVFNPTQNKLVTDPAINKFPSDLPDSGIRMILAFSQYEKKTPTSKVSYTDPATTFILPVPVNLKESYGIELATFSSGPISTLGVPKIALNALNSATSDLSSLYNIGVNALKAGDTALSQIAKNYAAGGNGTEGLARLISYYNVAGAGSFLPNQNNLINNEKGNMINPSTTVSLKGVPLRAHTFTWMLAPKSPQESETLMLMLNNMKMHMLPQSTNGGFYLGFPWVCFPAIFKGSDATPTPDGAISAANQLYVFKPSFVTSLTYNHAGGGAPAFFYDTKNPAIVELTINLQEIEMVIAPEDTTPATSGVTSGSFLTNAIHSTQPFVTDGFAIFNDNLDDTAVLPSAVTTAVTNPDNF